MEPQLDLASELARLKAIEREHRMTMLVLAVVTERLTAERRCDRVVISTDSLLNAPDLEAWRDQDLNRVIVRVSR